MPCYHPLKAFQCFDKTIVFDQTRKHDIVRSLDLPCGQCVGCRLERSRQWALRCMHEAQLHKQNSYITLTYDNTHLPSDGSLDHKDFQRFLKRFRKSLQNRGLRIRYYMAGEYGELHARPHFHAIIFGYGFPDQKPWKRTPAGFMLHRSQELETLWPFGHSTVGDVTFESAAYVARYIMKKQTGKDAESHYKRIHPETGEYLTLKPEYNRMSLRPMSGIPGEPGGIGADFYKQYTSDIYPLDYVILRGKKVKPPKYYDKLYKIDHPYEYDELLYMRENNAKLNSEDNTPERLLVKEQVTKAKLQQLKRNLT